MVVAVGLTVMLVPSPIEVPEQEPAYHFHEAPVPNEPPDTVNVVEPPGQKLLAEGLILAGAVERVFTFTVTWAQVVVPQSPSART